MKIKASLGNFEPLMNGGIGTNVYTLRQCFKTDFLDTCAKEKYSKLSRLSLINIFSLNYRSVYLS